MCMKVYVYIVFSAYLLLLLLLYIGVLSCIIFRVCDTYAINYLYCSAISIVM